jgi:hypothetical protein
VPFVIICKKQSGNCLKTSLHNSINCGWRVGSPPQNEIKWTGTTLVNCSSYNLKSSTVI